MCSLAATAQLLLQNKDNSCSERRLLLRHKDNSCSSPSKKRKSKARKGGGDFGVFGVFFYLSVAFSESEKGK